MSDFLITCKVLPIDIALQPKNFRMTYFLSRYPAVSHTFFLKGIPGFCLKEIPGFCAKCGSKLTLHLSIHPVGFKSSLLPWEAGAGKQNLLSERNGHLESLFVIVTVTLVNPVVAFLRISGGVHLDGQDIPRKIYPLFYTVEAFLLGCGMKNLTRITFVFHFGCCAATVALLPAETWD